MDALIVFLVFAVVLAIVVPRFGADSRDSQDWRSRDQALR
jgi:type II secretory pathway pseudopilin PulG